MTGYEVKVTPNRSRFDAARWRCTGTGESCGVWYSVHAAPWVGQLQAHDAAATLAVAHMRGPNHA